MTVTEFQRYTDLVAQSIALPRGVRCSHISQGQVGAEAPGGKTYTDQIIWPRVQFGEPLPVLDDGVAKMAAKALSEWVEYRSLTVLGYPPEVHGGDVLVCFSQKGRVPVRGVYLAWNWGYPTHIYRFDILGVSTMKKSGKGKGGKRGC